MLNVDLGGGRHRVDLKGKWTIMDISKADIVYDLNSMKPFPFEDISVDNYYSSMTLEHLYSDQLEFILKEIHRTLKFKGLFRTVVPDIEIGIQWYLNSPNKLFLKTSPTQNNNDLKSLKLGRLISWFFTPDRGRPNKMMNGHRMAYDFETMKYYLEKIGFRNVVKSSFNNGSPIFDKKDLPRYEEYGLFIECKR